MKFLFFRPEEVHHNFSVASLTGVLHRATQRRKYIREDRSLEKNAPDKYLEKKLSVNVVDTSEQSRSNSQMSVGASTVYQQTVSASNLMGEDRCFMAVKRRHTFLS